jgi:uncharacterized membrane protein
MMMYLGTFLFVMFFVLLAPQTRNFLGGLMLGAGAFIQAWAPFSYILLLLLAGALIAGVYLIRTWPVRVDAENPMAKYNREPPFEE